MDSFHHPAGGERGRPAQRDVTPQWGVTPSDGEGLPRARTGAAVKAAAGAERSEGSLDGEHVTEAGGWKEDAHTGDP